jgi:hypothetical protein
LNLPHLSELRSSAEEVIDEEQIAIAAVNLRAMIEFCLDVQEAVSKHRFKVGKLIQSGMYSIIVEIL